MTNQQKTYFLAPTWDYPPPPAGPFRLGNIIAKPDRPIPPIYTTASDHTLATANDTQSLQPYNGYRIQQNVLSWSKEDAVTKKFGIWTEFLSFLGLGADIGAGQTKSVEEIYTFETMTTIAFAPSRDFLQDVLADENIAYYFQGFRPHPPPLYIVTGIKYVSGAKCKRVVSNSKSLEHSVGIDATLLGCAPVRFGPEVVVDKSRKEGGSFEGGDDFVFAYQLRKLKVKRLVVKAEEHTKGALYDIGSSRPRSSRVKYEFTDFDEEDFGGKAVQDDGETVFYVV